MIRLPRSARFAQLMTALAVVSLLVGCGGVGKASEKPAEGAEIWFDAALNVRSAESAAGAVHSLTPALSP